VAKLSVGDPAGSVAGILFGRHKLSKLVGRRAGNKTVEGALGCWLASFAASILAVQVERRCYDPLVLGAGVSRVFLAAVAGVGATIGEAVDLGCDDNLTLPLVSALLLQVVTMATA
jgi:dolichol kinase